MITVYKLEDDGSVSKTTIEKSQLENYKNLGWSETPPLDLTGVIEDEGKAGQDIVLGGGVNYTSTSPFGYPSLINTGQKNEDGTPKFQDVNVYLQGLNPQGNWYYPGDEDVMLDKLSPNEIRTLQDRLVRTQWFDMEAYSQEYGRPGRETRNALIKAMTASTSSGIGSMISSVSTISIGLSVNGSTDALLVSLTVTSGPSTDILAIASSL